VVTFLIIFVQYASDSFAMRHTALYKCVLID